MENLTSKLIHFLNGGETITFSEKELESFIEVIEHLTVIDTLQNLHHSNVEKDIEEHHSALKALASTFDLESVLKDENIHLPFWFLFI